jgi:hypothetical protein
MAPIAGRRAAMPVTPADEILAANYAVMIVRMAGVVASNGQCSAPVSRALALSEIPGKRRRSSMAAESPARS